MVLSGPWLKSGSRATTTAQSSSLTARPRSRAKRHATSTPSLNRTVYAPSVATLEANACAIGSLIAYTPCRSESHLAVSKHGQTAMMGTDGRSLTSRSADLPVAVNTMMAHAPMPSASVADEDKMASEGLMLATPRLLLAWEFAADVSRCASAASITRRCMATHSAGYLPTADSPLSMTASQPSRMAFATSLHSARVGVGQEIMDSSICVATITGFPAARAFKMMSFWTNGTCSGFISTPRSPLATITPSQASRILTRSLTAAGFSILARSFMLEPPSSFTSFRSSNMSSCL
mmetsp:Transcript_21600/g.34563  ORF Transcript_21600/g.34563 Transcript_21600/m.34563 type:complete len:292 (-) Transcript_21600:1226-2101(-)